MIITKEKYKDSYIVYIDETTRNIGDPPAHAAFECLRTALSQVYADGTADIQFAYIGDNALRRQRLGERRADFL